MGICPIIAGAAAMEAEGSLSPTRPCAGLTVAAPPPSLTTPSDWGACPQAVVPRAPLSARAPSADRMRGILNIREGRRVVNPSAFTAPAPRFISLCSQLFQVAFIDCSSVLPQCPQFAPPARRLAGVASRQSAHRFRIRGLSPYVVTLPKMAVPLIFRIL